MKLITAVIKPFKLEEVRSALTDLGLQGMTVTEVKGYGRQKSYLDQYEGSEYALAFLPKVEITLWVDDARAEEIIRKIVAVARTGRMGDGKIFVLPAADKDSVIDIASHTPAPAATSKRRRA